MKTNYDKEFKGVFKNVTICIAVPHKNYITSVYIKLIKCNITKKCRAAKAWWHLHDICIYDKVRSVALCSSVKQNFELELISITVAWLATSQFPACTFSKLWYIYCGHVNWKINTLSLQVAFIFRLYTVSHEIKPTCTFNNSHSFEVWSNSS